MPKPSKRDQLVEATKELLWEAGYEAMSPRDIQARRNRVGNRQTDGSFLKSLRAAQRHCWSTTSLFNANARARVLGL